MTKDRIITKEKKKNSIITVVSLIIIGLILVGVMITYFNHFNLAANKIIRDQLVVVEEGVTPKSGLFLDTLETGFDPSNELSSKYYFKGDQVNNHLIFENGCWRIIHITQNNLLKIVYMGASVDNKCVDKSSLDGNVNTNDLIWGSDNNHFLESVIFEKLNEWVKNDTINDLINIDFNSPDSKVETVSWNIGSIDFTSNFNSLNADVINEAANNNFTSKLGLISVTDYLKAGCQVGSFSSNPSCKDNNYLYTGINYWTIINDGASIDKAWAVVEDGSVNSALINETYGIYPVLYLKSNVKLTGLGTPSQPYIVE